MGNYSLSWLIQGNVTVRAEFIKLWREAPLSSKTPSDIEEYLKKGAAGVVQPPWRTRVQPEPVLTEGSFELKFILETAAKLDPIRTTVVKQAGRPPPRRAPAGTNRG